MKTLEDAERVIQREYNWLKTNKTARDEAKQIEAEIARDIVPVMERFKAGDYARVAYGKGDRLRKDGLDVPLDALHVEDCADVIAAALRAN